MHRALLLLALSGCCCPPLSKAVQGASSRQNYRSPPQAERCNRHKGARQKDCALARHAALERVRKLYVDDQVCLDGEHSLFEPDGDCHTRAFVEGVSSEGVQLEVRKAGEGSGYQMMENVWFHELALVDLELQSQGY